MEILIVEDDRIIAHGLLENLQDLGYNKVQCVYSASDARTSLKQEGYDICIMDVDLGENQEDGINVVQDLRAELDTIFIYLTSYDNEEIINRAKKSDPAAYLIKPTTKEQISVTLDLAIQHHQSNLNNPILPEENGHTADDVVFVKDGGRYYRVAISDIKYCEAAGAYTKIVTNRRTLLHSGNLKAVVEVLGKDRFIRTHKSFAAQKDYIDSFDLRNVYVQYLDSLVAIPISRGKKEHVFQQMKKL